MAGETDHSRHYVRGDLPARLEAALRDDGADPERPTPEALAMPFAEASFDGACSMHVAMNIAAKPPYRAVFLIHAEIATQAIANTGRALAESRLIPIEVLCRSRP